MNPESKFLIVLVGATAVGKTALALKLASFLKCEILSADARQFYQEMSIGTAKPTPEELNAVPHHFINNKKIQEEYSAGQYEKEALEMLKKQFISNKFAVLVGGSGLFIKAICEGFDEFPETNPEHRNALNAEFERNGIAPLLEKLKIADPEYYHIVDQKNPKRIIRALEIYLSSGRPYSEFRKSELTKRPFQVIKVGIELDRKELYDRINVRVDEMFNAGLEQEVRNLIPFKDYNALKTVGYTELFDYFDGKYDQKKTIELIKQHTRNYAKRQMTWFKKDAETMWFSPNEFEKICTFIKEKTN